MRSAFWTALVSGAAASALLAPTAFGADAKTDARIEQLEQQIELLSQQVKDLKTGTASKFAETKRAADAQPVVSLDNGRPTFKTADGNFTASLRSLVQWDAGYYIQKDAPAGSDLSSGTNFRRARIGLEGTLYKDWEYSFIYDFGGSGVEGTTISQAYLQYNGWKPFYVRAGAFPPYTSHEDSGGASETIFLERAAVVETVRSIAGSDGREGASLTYAGDRLFGSVAYTGAKVGDAAVFDEQQGVVGRVAGLVYSDANTKINIGANGSYVFDLSDTTAGPGSVNQVRFQERPDLRIDGTRLIDTGNFGTAANPTRSITTWGVDGAAAWKSLYGEGGYFKISAERGGTGLASANPEFTGWYAQATWLVTGESRRYDPLRGAFRSPKVAHPLNFGDDPGFGALELAVRYDTLDLNFNSNLSTANGGLRGGVQDVWTFGANWYANNAVRLSLNYLLIDVDRQAQGTTPPFASLSQKAQAIAFRSQISF